MDSNQVLRAGLALLDRFEDAELSLAETLDRLEAITSDPRLHRQILDEAVERELITIDRSKGNVQPLTKSFLRFQSDVITKEGSFTCRRCGHTLSKGYFVQVDGLQIGPFGSSCIRKITGRA